ncbi:hypothetical protein BDZ89DRAFT_551039 [Hymenopellis radicata]|nr:hypothetical protein BDZ89DRAFT_551039 [Hymenopellis radicata]
MLHVMLHATVDHPALTLFLMTSSRWQTAAVSLPPKLYHAWNADLTFQSLARFHLHVQLDGMRTWRDLRPAGCRKALLDFPQLQVFSSDTVGAWSQILSWRSKFPRLQCFEQTGILDAQLYATGVSFTAPLAMVSAPLLTSALFHPEKAISSGFYNTVMTCPICDEYPNMRILRLRGTSAGYSHFFSKFRLPCLEALSFEDSNLGGDLAFPSPLVAPTGQHLQQLEVPLQNANDTNSLVVFLRTTPRLHRLELRARTHFDISHTIRAVLVDEGALLPELTDLVISSMNQNGVLISGAFVEAIKHRRSGAAQVAKLQEVLVDFVTAIVDEDVVAAFNDLLSDGLRGALKNRPWEAYSGWTRSLDVDS